MTTDNKNATDNFDPRWLDAQLQTIGRGADKIIPLLQAIQKQYNYLPQIALSYLCEKSDITPADAVGVSTFYPQFRHSPKGRYDINVCVGTACHIKGADLVYDGFRRYLNCEGESDTDPQNLFTLNKVACLGCCSLAPAVQIGGVIYGHVTAADAKDILNDFLNRQKENDANKTDENKKNANKNSIANEIRICLGSCCAASGTIDIEQAARKIIAQYDLRVNIKIVGCVGICHRTPLVEIIANGASYFYAQVKADDMLSIILKHFKPLATIHKISAKINSAIETLFLSQPINNTLDRLQMRTEDSAVKNFLDAQVRIATQHYGAMTPLDINEYINNGGFNALKICLNELSADDVVCIIKNSQLRGRGGAGFLTGMKWEAVKNSSQNGEVFLICNGDEGDPGAFMDRMLLESFPFRIIEGMLIAAYATGAREAIFYIRSEYPYSIKTIHEAITICEEQNFIGENILGTKFCARIKIFEGAGAFVCGEETALIKSIEGKRATPTLKPPYPSSCGLFGKPTLVNNCETFACVPWIINNGASAFKNIGTSHSCGTKVFALAGKIARGGLIETPMGITIKEIVSHIGGDIANGKKFKAIQIGGPSGGCVPASHENIPIDYEELLKEGAMMGSGGLVVLDERDCMVDIAKYFLAFTQNQSCGRCTFCRIGTKQMLGILEKICAGQGTQKDLQELEELALSIKKASLCGLGKTAPNPVLTTIKYFRDEYEAHIKGECTAGKCKALISYKINDNCNGCTICSQECPANAIAFTPYVKHIIDDALCTRCDVCRVTCPANAVDIIPKKQAVNTCSN